MKKYILSVIMLLAVAVVGCSNGNNDDNPAQKDVFTVSGDLLRDGIGLDNNGTAITVGGITATKAVDVAVDAQWCSASLKSAGNDAYTLTVSASANDDTKARTATVTLSSINQTRNIKVVQAAGEEKPIEPAPSSANSADFFGLGWNIGNQMDSHINGVASETGWGNPTATRATFAKAAQAGFTSVRIPVTWLGRFGVAPSYEIDAEWIARVGELVGFAKDAGMKVIINIHHDGAPDSHGYWLDIKKASVDASANAAIKSQIAVIWTQIAEYFKNEGEYLVFEAFNEIHDGGWGWGDNRKDGGKQYAVLNEWNQTFVDAVRATGGNNATRWLGVPGYCTNADLTVDPNNFTLPTDKANRLMVAIHSYDPSNYTLEGKFSQWGHTAMPSKKESWGDEEHFKQLFASVRKAFIDKGIPVYVGEFGCVNRADAAANDFRRYYLEYTAKLMHDHGIGAFIWDNGVKVAGRESHGYLDHATGDYANAEAKTMIDAMVRAFTSDYTLDDVYSTAP